MFRVWNRFVNETVLFHHKQVNLAFIDFPVNLTNIVNIINLH